MPRRRGLGQYGKGKFNEAVDNANAAPETGEDTGYSLPNYDVIAQQLRQGAAPQEVSSLPDLWPDTSNYGQGPSQSTRVSRHSFVLEQGRGEETALQLGTVYVKFTNLRQRADGSVYEKKGSGVVYAYRDVPYHEYMNFARSNSKGREINKWTRSKDYDRIGWDDSVFNQSFFG